MAITDTTLDELVEREDKALGRVCELASAVDPGLVVSDWTAHQVLAHLVTVIRRYTNPEVRLASTAREVDVVNAEEMAALADAPVPELVEALRAGHAAYQELWVRFPLDAELRFHAGLRFDAASLRSNWIGELLMHGRDVAVAAGRPWLLEDRDMLLVLRVTMRALPGYVRADGGGPVRVGVRVDGGMPQRIVVDGDSASVADGAGEADVVLSGSPAAAALLFYGRSSVAEAEGTGLVVDGDRSALARFLTLREVP